MTLIFCTDFSWYENFKEKTLNLDDKIKEQMLVYA